VTSLPSLEQSKVILVNPDTTGGSLIHRLALYKGPGSPMPPRIKTYIASVLITYVPLLLFVILGPTPRSGLSSFFQDWPVGFVFLVSFPTLVLMSVTDEHVLTESLTRVQAEGVMCVPEKGARTVESLRARFRNWNILAHIVGIALGAYLAWATLTYYTSRSVYFWTVSETGLLFSAYVFLWCLTLLYAVIAIYVARSLLVSFLLKELAANATFHLLPFHPDKCGGLQPVGQLGLRNQYVLSILGLNVVLLIMASPTAAPHPIIVGAVVAYVVLGPIVFMGPLLPFRRGMYRAKAAWIGDVEHWLHGEARGLRVRLRAAQITKEDEDAIDRMRRIGGVVNELPVWPFDAKTVRTFTTAYIVPLGLSLLGQLLMAWLKVKG
jgi:hypothetical protein